jgi:hypothetical protein
MDTINPETEDNVQIVPTIPEYVPHGILNKSEWNWIEGVHILDTVNLKLCNIKASVNLVQPAKNFKENLPFYKVTSKTKLRYAYVHLLHSSSPSCH